MPPDLIDPTPEDPPVSVSQEPPAYPSSVPAAPVDAPVTPAAPVAAPTELAAAAPAEPQHEPTLVDKFIQERDAKKVAETAPADPAKPIDPAKPEDPAPKVEAKPEEAAPAAEAAPFDPAVHEFELPATIQGKSPQMDEFRGLLAERDKLPPREFAQSLVNLHAKSMQEFVDSYAAEASKKQWDVWNDSQQKLQSEVMADPLIGGNNFGGAMEKIAKFRDEFVPQAEMAEFDQALRLSGAGNMAPVLRALYRAQSRFDEPRMPPENPRPPRDIGQRPNRPGGLRQHYNTNGN